MRKYIVIILILFFIAICCTVSSPAEAGLGQSPHDTRVMYLPSVGTNLYRICNEDRSLSRFLEFKDVNYILIDSLDGLPQDTRFAVYLQINTEFENNEYMELIILDENEIDVYNNGIKVPVEKFNKYNIIHIIDSGLVTIS